MINLFNDLPTGTCGKESFENRSNRSDKTIIEVKSPVIEYRLFIHHLRSLPHFAINGFDALSRKCTFLDLPFL